jgi:hypothetical protein
VGRFVRVSSNAQALPVAIGIDAARALLSALCARNSHRLLTIGMLALSEGRDVELLSAL